MLVLFLVFLLLLETVMFLCHHLFEQINKNKLAHLNLPEKRNGETFCFLINLKTKLRNPDHTHLIIMNFGSRGNNVPFLFDNFNCLNFCLINLLYSPSFANKKGNEQKNRKRKTCNIHVFVFLLSTETFNFAIYISFLLLGENSINSVCYTIIMLLSSIQYSW